MRSKMDNASPTRPNWYNRVAKRQPNQPASGNEGSSFRGISSSTHCWAKVTNAGAFSPSRK